MEGKPMEGNSLLGLILLVILTAACTEGGGIEFGLFIGLGLSFLAWSYSK